MADTVSTPLTALNALLAFDLATHLPSYPLPRAAPLFWLSFAASYAVCYLVHLPWDTRVIRMGLWPVAVGANLWAVLVADMRGYQLTWTIVSPETVLLVALITHQLADIIQVGLMLFNATSASVRWAYATSPPIYHPLPRSFSYPSLRESTPFKALDLILNEPRLLSLSGYSNPLPHMDGSRIHHVLRHLGHFVLAYICIDIVSYPLYYLDGSVLGHPLAYSADWDSGIDVLVSKTGLPGVVLAMAVTLSGAIETYCGMAMVWHMAAVVGVGSGIWIPEEWPKIMNRPWMSTSLNELWGKRYHQNGFQTYSRPFSFLPSSVRLLRIFLISAIYHTLCYYPHHRILNFRANGLMFLLSGLGLEGERQFFYLTGKRVGGWSGRIWTWMWCLFCGYFMMRAVAEIGWLGGLRREFEKDRRMSAVEWVLYAWGERPHPGANLDLPVSLEAEVKA